MNVDETKVQFKTELQNILKYLINITLPGVQLFKGQLVFKTASPKALAVLVATRLHQSVCLKHVVH